MHNYLKRSFLLNDFADLVSFSFNSIEFHISGNKAEGKHSRVLKRTCSSLYDFVLFGSAKELNLKNIGSECALNELLFTALIAFFAKI